MATLGRLDELKQSGQLEGLVESLAKFSDHLAVLNALRADQTIPSSTTHVGPPLVFQRLWEDLIEEALFAQRRDLFSGLRLVFLAYHIDLLRGARWRVDRATWLQQGSSS